ncbi:Zinc finger PHD-type [Penicillium argentinense]|uniref:Chromatin modification-related protein n=1 Tax=Penicillium argentinense TaxID=1131581 RepID=A0A9W9G0G6_9EURO|nr:Zinc finger PHD-type [Penicillium argentinense]KAJ5109698.1 Zinc finger PHD-type [Penicillium argentinense]
MAGKHVTEGDESATGNDPVAGIIPSAEFDESDVDPSKDAPFELSSDEDAATLYSPLGFESRSPSYCPSPPHRTRKRAPAGRDSKPRAAKQQPKAQPKAEKKSAPKKTKSRKQKRQNKQPKAQEPPQQKPQQQPKARPPKRATMAHGAEDCATVLEQFVHDSANLPLEINHLMEEIQAKDKIMQEARAIINSRDASIQRFIKLNGSLVVNPKEKQYEKEVNENFEKCKQLQEEKVALSDKACVLLDRHIKRFDLRIRDLVNDGLLPNDPPLPSLLDNPVSYRDPPKVFFPDSAPTDSPSYSTPLNTNTATTNPILAAAQQLRQATAPPMTTATALAQAAARSSAPATPVGTTAAHLQQRQRESSAGAVDNKRRRMNPSLGTLPSAPSNLRQGSLGPGTPKAGTPASSRAGSAGPRAIGGNKKALTKKVAPHQQVKKVKSSSGLKSSKRSSSASGRVKVSKKSPGDGGEDDDDSLLSSADMSDSDKNDDSVDDDDDGEEEEEGAEDTEVYCTCRTVSHGDMVACDNIKCPYEWFHWKCVGLTTEPQGKWYCDECRKTMGEDDE